MLKFILFIFIIFINPLQAQIKVLAFAGSSRTDSVNKKLVEEAARVAKHLGAAVKVIDLKDFPFPLYNADQEAKDGMPIQVLQLRKLMIESDVIFISSPEYNHSVSAVLKNVIDWMSRGEKRGLSQDAFKGKKFVIMSASPSLNGGAKGLIHLKEIIEVLGGDVVSYEMVVPRAYDAFDHQRQLKDPVLQKKLEKLVKASLN